MNKKGELSLRFIILLMLALLALVVIAIIFQDQISSFVDAITGTSSDLSTSLSDATEGLK